MEQESGSIGIRDVLVVIFKRKRMILGTFAVLAGAVLAVAFFYPHSHVASSTILVKMGREYLNDADIGEEKKVMAVGMGDILNAEIQILTNPGIVDRTIKAMGVARLYPALENDPDALKKAEARFQRNLKVEGIRNSSVIRVSFRHASPQVATEAVKTIVDLYREKHLQVFSTPRSSFLEGQLASYEEQLRDSERRFEDFKQKKGVYSLDEQRTLLLQQRISLDGNLKDATNRIEELERKLAVLKRQDAAAARDDLAVLDPETDKAISDTKAKLLSLQLEEEQLLKKYNESSRVVKGIRKEIAIVQDFLRNQESSTRRGRNPGQVAQQVRLELNRTEAELSALQGRVRVARSQLHQIGGEISDLERNSRQFQELKRDLATTEKNYQIYAAKAEEARLSEDMNRRKLANISIIQEASVPADEGGRRKPVALAGIILSLLTALASAFLTEKLSQTVSTPDRAERLLGIPVLATISRAEAR